MVKGFFLDKSPRSLDHLFTQSLYTSTANQLSTQCYSCLVFIIKMPTVRPITGLEIITEPLTDTLTEFPLVESHHPEDGDLVNWLG